ncbi:MAG: DUF1848 domain-containing protein [Kiloniellales bacterium]
MIVSASYRTDIPAFYDEWFRRRLEDGFCRTVNPYGGGIYETRLTPDAVDGFVFWTRNAEPFFDTLNAIRRRFAFVAQFTITGYPRALERSVIETHRAVAQMHDLARDFGPRAAVWRYDPILIGSLTPPDWHRESFRRLAGALAGATDEVVTSFATLYRKTRRNLAAAARLYGFDWRDPAPAEKTDLITELAAVARDHGMRLSLCSQPEFLAPGARPARCIDADRLSEIAGRSIPAKEKGNRPGCACHQSRDIGDYDTCPHGCVYCYAVQTPALARRRHRAHDPKSPFLFPPQGAVAGPSV